MWWARRRWDPTLADEVRTSPPPPSWWIPGCDGAGWGERSASTSSGGPANGYRGIQFNAVVETNRPAVARWTDLGFAIVGTVPEAFDHPEHGLVGLHVMYLPIAPPS